MDINENQLDTNLDAKSSDQSSNTNDDIKFVPFSDYINTYHQQLLNQSSTNPNSSDMDKCLNQILKNDISTMPFIPNPYYMMNMNKPLPPSTTPSTDGNQRQPKSFHNDNDFHHNYDSHYDHDFHPNFHPNYNPNFYPNYNPNFYPNYNIPPYYYPNQYGPNGVNPLALLLFSSMFR